MAACCEVLAFGLGALTSMPAVRNFSICAAIAVALDFLLQVGWHCLKHLLIAHWVVTIVSAFSCPFLWDFFSRHPTHASRVQYVACLSVDTVHCRSLQALCMWWWQFAWFGTVLAMPLPTCLHLAGDCVHGAACVGCKAPGTVPPGLFAVLASAIQRCIRCVVSVLHLMFGRRARRGGVHVRWTACVV